jgi:glycosyltransferase involved in cell wall biosynthesis
VLGIVSTRNLYPLYRIDTLVDAFAAVSAAVDARLVICGDGPERDALERRVREAGLAENVTFTGRLDPAGIAGALKRADIYVSTSVSDSTSVSLLEAMACGTIPVVTDLAANREWVRSGRSGALFPPGDHEALASAILAIRSNPAEAEAMRNEAAREVERRGLWLPNMERVEAERVLDAGKRRAALQR